jgi:hypothetical protein
MEGWKKRLRKWRICLRDWGAIQLIQHRTFGSPTAWNDSDPPKGYYPPDPATPKAARTTPTTARASVRMDAPDA